MSADDLMTTLTQYDGCEEAADHKGREVLDPCYLRYKQFYSRDIFPQEDPRDHFVDPDECSWLWAGSSEMMSTITS